MRELILRLNNIIAHTSISVNKTPNGLSFLDDEFFITTGNTPKIFALSGEEKKLLQQLTNPMGNIAPSSPMVAKRLRTKLNIVLSNLDIITVRGHGYKLVDISADTNNKDII